MRITTMLVAIAIVVTGAARASAEDTLLDLSSAEQVAAALRDVGYKAELKKNDDGSTYVLSAANGSGFTIDMTNCKALKCNGLSFQSYYDPEPVLTLAFANQWNNDNRFLKVSINAKGQLREWFDVDTFGKLTKANFADLIDWYQTMDAGLAKFVKEKREVAKAAKPAK